MKFKRIKWKKNCSKISHKTLFLFLMEWNRCINHAVVCELHGNEFEEHWLKFQLVWLSKCCSNKNPQCLAHCNGDIWFWQAHIDFAITFWWMQPMNEREQKHKTPIRLWINYTIKMWLLDVILSNGHWQMSRFNVWTDSIAIKMENIHSNQTLNANRMRWARD